MGIIKLAQMSEIGKKIEKRVIFRSFRQFLQILEIVLPILQIILNERTLFHVIWNIELIFCHFKKAGDH